MNAPSARTLRVTAALSIALATVIGALGAHALKTRLPADRLEVLHTAVHYQFFHALGLLGLGLYAERDGSGPIRRAGAWVLLGMVLFSGSLYVLLLGAPKWFGVVTPLGGVSLIAGWLMAAWSFARERAP